ncbi:MAG: hypothetical protein AAGC99_06955 [Pseudomonadota bacterium]
MFKRIGAAIAFILLIVALVGIGTGHYKSWLRDADYSLAVHKDESTLSTGVVRELGPDDVELFVRTERDEIQRLVADREELAAFVEGQLAQLKQNRAIAKDVASKDAELVMRLSFADADARVENYADWFYEWKRSYILLKETVLSSAHRTVASGSETWREAVERDISDYFMRHFTDQVLQPERREPLVEAGVRNMLEHAHSSFLRAVSDYDLRLQLFLQQHTTHFDRDATNDGVEIELDWDAQRWKAPLYTAEDRSFDGALGVGLMVASTAGGRTLGRVLAPQMATIVRQNLSRLAARTSAQLASRASTTAAGASAGSAVPVVGSAVGAALGFAAGAALDYMGNRMDKWLHREEFIAENMEAVAMIEAEWRRALEHELHRSIDAWFDDAEILLKELRPAAS